MQNGPVDAPQGYCLQCGSALQARFQEDRERPTCPQCGFIHYLDPKVAVAVVLGDENGLLLGLRNINPGKGAWSFPAGYVNRGEELEAAAAREVAEEIGVVARLDGLVGVYSHPGDPVVLVVYAGVIAAGEPRPDGREVSEVRRFALSELPRMGFRHDDQIVADWRRTYGKGVNAAGDSGLTRVVRPGRSSAA